MELIRDFLHANLDDKGGLYTQTLTQASTTYINSSSNSFKAEEIARLNAILFEAHGCGCGFTLLFGMQYDDTISGFTGRRHVCK